MEFCEFVNIVSMYVKQLKELIEHFKLETKGKLTVRGYQDFEISSINKELVSYCALRKMVCL